MPTTLATPRVRWVFASYGMGGESTAWLHETLTDPTRRPAELLPDLSNLIVATAQTGDEWSLTGELVEEHILPLIRERNVRFVEVARKGPAKADGVAVLQDTRQPYRVHLDGDYKLSYENRDSGTMPILSGHHTCAQKSKGEPLDWWRAKELGDDPYLHMMGFNVDEENRIKRDSAYIMGGQRTPFYPVRDAGMTRAECVEYLYRALVDTNGVPLGVIWPKSCCRQCPYISVAGWPDQLRLFLDRPREAMQHLVDEYVTLALNPRSGLFGPGRSLIGRLERANATEVLSFAANRMRAMPWAVYRVRRRFTGPANAPRSVQRLMVGPRQEIRRNLATIADYAGLPLTRGEEIPGAPKRIRDTDRFPRIWINRRAESTYPSLEEFLVAAPAQMGDKERSTFEAKWTEIRSASLMRREVQVGRTIKVIASLAGDRRRRDEFGVVDVPVAA